MNVIVTGGGTAGHVFPALATARSMRDRFGASVTFIGAAGGQEATLVPAAGFTFVGLRVAAAQSRRPLQTLRAIALSLRGARACRPAVRSADVVISIGGFASAPAVLAARRCRRPLVLIEPNTVPGVVNRIAARWASVVATAFDGTAARLPTGTRVERTGNPIRAEIVAVVGARDRLRAEARAAFDLHHDRTTVLVVGGSQGALHIDEAIAAALPLLRDRGDLQLLVSTGPDHLDVVHAAIEVDAAVVVRAVPFIDRMDRALAIADVAVSRAGAGVAELAACGLPAILVPYPHATENHQEANARELVAAGAAQLLLDADLSPSALAAAILSLVDAGERRRAMAVAARAWSRPDAADRIAALAAELAGATDDVA
jgi:UDP-N-acetylglucosamine--N-acetylmuramyl-(pentapeptide) pyrophosphoryl-undecaprenol N-acetylglucosamine transferase